MSDLVKALTILLKYGDPRNPFACEHDTLTVCGVAPSTVSAEDTEALLALGFLINPREDCFYSFRFGSA